MSETVNGADLSRRILRHGTTAAEVANMDVEALTRTVANRRKGWVPPWGVDPALTDDEIARAILQYAQSEPDDWPVPTTEGFQRRNAIISVSLFIVTCLTTLFSMVGCNPVSNVRYWIMCRDGDCDLREAYLPGASLLNDDLRGADLSGANLRKADLRTAKLREANLAGADLSGANLHRADLRGADLSGANLNGADLSRVNLENANLTGADLSGARLEKAWLSGADFQGATMPDGTVHE